MSPASSFRILSPSDGPAVEVLNGRGSAPLVPVCEHASAFVPKSLEGLGLDPAHRLSHAAWDPGALAVARTMSEALDAPLVAARVSRLVYDCNRPPDAPGAMPEQSELIAVPGNRDIGPGERAARVAEVYWPFRDALSTLLEQRPEALLVTVHSFSPTWHGTPRPAEIGLLHDADPALARAMLAEAGGLPWRVELNVPYSAADGVTHTLAEHGTAAGRPAAMIEIRNDLIADTAAAQVMGRALAAICLAALARREAAE